MAGCDTVFCDREAQVPGDGFGCDVDRWYGSTDDLRFRLVKVKA